jgi:uncharacterized membrane protein
VVSWGTDPGGDISRLIARLRESLFAIPAVIVVLCVGLALLALYLEAVFGESLEEWPLILGTTVTGARTIANSVAGGMITVAAIVFSMTALSTQMAASQYSPRALGGFFDDPFQQSIIGLVVGTFTYSLVVLASLGNALIDGSAATPSLSVTLAIVLAVLSVLGIVVYINHSLRRMQIDSVVKRISASAIKAIDRHLDGDATASISEGSPTQGTPSTVRSDSGGWVVGIDADRALAALEAGATARVDVRLGEAVSPGDRILTVWPDPGDAWEGAPQLRRSVVLSDERSLELDPTFGIRQLVDIALRALSPGVNDPTTAVDVIHHLKTPVRKVLLSAAPKRVFTGDDDRRVFLANIPSRSDYVHFAFSEIRLAASRQPYVLAALLEVLADLEQDLEEAGLDGREQAVHEEIELTLEVAKSSGLPEPDLQRVLNRSNIGVAGTNQSEG